MDGWMDVRNGEGKGVIHMVFFPYLFMDIPASYYTTRTTRILFSSLISSLVLIYVRYDIFVVHKSR